MLPTLSSGCRVQEEGRERGTVMCWKKSKNSDERKGKKIDREKSTVVRNNGIQVKEREITEGGGVRE